MNEQEHKQQIFHKLLYAESKQKFLCKANNFLTEIAF